MPDVSLERWLPIPGHPGYGVSDMGRVYSWKSGRYLGRYLKWGRYAITLTTCLGTVERSVARLVLEVFVRAHRDGELVGFRDGNRENVALFNLEWRLAFGVARQRGRKRLGIENCLFQRATDPTWEGEVYE